MRIRRYREGDREAVRLLHDEALYEVGAHLGEGPWDEDLDRIESEYLHDGGEFLVGELDERRSSETDAIDRSKQYPRSWPPF